MTGHAAIRNLPLESRVVFRLVPRRQIPPPALCIPGQRRHKENSIAIRHERVTPLPRSDRKLNGNRLTVKFRVDSIGRVEPDLGMFEHSVFDVYRVRPWPCRRNGDAILIQTAGFDRIKTVAHDGYKQAAPDVAVFALIPGQADFDLFDLGPGLLERAAAGLDRGAGRHDVVDQQDTPAPDPSHFELCQDASVRQIGEEVVRTLRYYLAARPEVQASGIVLLESHSCVPPVSRLLSGPGIAPTLTPSFFTPTGAACISAKQITGD